MERLIDIITSFLNGVLNLLATIANGAISAVQVPAYWIGVRPEILMIVIVCVGMLFLWRSLGGLR